jgi:hypothetical protein
LREQTVFTSANPEGSAFGAAALVFRQSNVRPFKNQCERIRAVEIAGLGDYRREWRRAIELMRDVSQPAMLSEGIR